MNFFLVFIGGGIGAVLRLLVASGIQLFPKTTFPVATLVVNLLASLLLGFILGFIKTKGAQMDLWNSFLVIGLCGGFSTFSTFSRENLELIEQNQWFYAIANILVSVVFGMVILYLARK